MNPLVDKGPETSASQTGEGAEGSASEVNINEELVTLIRGLFSAPMISSLGMSGALDVMLAREQFSPIDLPNPNKKLLEYTFQYFVRIGLLDYVDRRSHCCRLNDLGRQVFRRANSFYAPHSYRDYIQHYGEELKNSGTYRTYTVDRLENIIGSGRTHERYFPPAVSFLKRRVQLDVIADIGCGDGRFLEFVLKGVPNLKIVGIDLSEISVASTSTNLRNKFPGREIHTICADAGDIKKWAEPLERHAANQKLAISMWFLLHEISQHDPARVIKFLTEVHRRFPQSSLVIGELVRQTPEFLAKNKKYLLMPEYLLFHDLSGQGVLSWAQYQMILKNVPYQLATERVFDEIVGPDGTKEPAAFVWCLNPQ